MRSRAIIVSVSRAIRMLQIVSDADSQAALLSAQDVQSDSLGTISSLETGVGISSYRFFKAKESLMRTQKE